MSKPYDGLKATIIPAAPNGNILAASTRSAPRFLNAPDTSSGVLAISIEDPKYSYALRSPVIKFPIIGSANRSHVLHTNPKTPLGGNASRITTRPPGLHTRYISSIVASKSLKFRSVYAVNTQSNDASSYAVIFAAFPKSHLAFGIARRASRNIPGEQSNPVTSAPR